MLKVDKLIKYYGDLKALDEISFSVKKGEITGFLGPNGAGKTTSLRIITGYLTPEKGAVTYDNKSIFSRYKDISNNIGYLPENNPLYSNLRVDELLTFTANMKGSDESLESIVKECGLKDVLTKEIDTLSKGYKQRVGLAKSLIGNPKYLVLDEPTEGLDPNQKTEILKLIKNFAKDKTIIFSSHVLSEVTQIADKVIIINKGKIVAHGKSDELVKEHFKNASIIIKTDAPFQSLRKELIKLDSVSEVKLNTKGRERFKEFEITCSEAEEVSLEVFQKIVRNKWNLTELHKKSLGLEELFKELTK